MQKNQRFFCLEILKESMILDGITPYGEKQTNFTIFT